MCTVDTVGAEGVELRKREIRWVWRDYAGRQGEVMHCLILVSIVKLGIIGYPYD